MKILNCTQHKATQDQVEAGVIDLDDATRAELCELFVFTYLPCAGEVRIRADDIAWLIAPIYRAIGASAVMIGGAPFFMSALEHALFNKDMRPIYAFSKRESVETIDADGTVRKTSVFKHVGFVEA